MGGGSVTDQPLDGLCILVVEDEFLIAADIEDVIADAGGDSLAVPSVAKALAQVERGGFDAALLDVRLPDGDVFPVAEALEAKGVPIVFHSGHARHEECARFEGAQLLTKPVPPRTIVEALLGAVRRGQSEGAA